MAHNPRCALIGACSRRCSESRRSGQIFSSDHAETRNAQCFAGGVFQPLSDREQDDAKRLESTYAGATGQAFEHPEILVELERLQNKRSNWLAGLLVLLISLGLFMAASDRSSRETRRVRR